LIFKYIYKFNYSPSPVCLLLV